MWTTFVIVAEGGDFLSSLSRVAANYRSRAGIRLSVRDFRRKFLLTANPNLEQAAELGVRIDLPAECPLLIGRVEA
jgi:hypothetical protein